MEKERIQELFAAGIDCSQVVAGEFAEALGLDEGLVRRMSACFGGGMMRGETCGAVTGALMVLGLRYGHFKEGDLAQKGVMAQKAAEFSARFAEAYPSPLCRDLLGHDVSRPGELEKAMEENLIMDFCPLVVQRALDILRGMV